MKYCKKHDHQYNVSCLFCQWDVIMGWEAQKKKEYRRIIANGNSAQDTVVLGRATDAPKATRAGDGGEE